HAEVNPLFLFSLFLSARGREDQDRNAFKVGKFRAFLSILCASRPNVIDRSQASIALNNYVVVVGGANDERLIVDKAVFQERRDEFEREMRSPLKYVLNVGLTPLAILREAWVGGVKPELIRRDVLESYFVIAARACHYFNSRCVGVSQPPPERAVGARRCRSFETCRESCRVSTSNLPGNPGYEHTPRRRGAAPALFHHLGPSSPSQVFAAEARQDGEAPRASGRRHTLMVHPIHGADFATGSTSEVVLDKTFLLARRAALRLYPVACDMVWSGP